MLFLYRDTRIVVSTARAEIFLPNISPTFHIAEFMDRELTSRRLLVDRPTFQACLLVRHRPRVKPSWELSSMPRTTRLFCEIRAALNLPTDLATWFMEDLLIHRPHGL